MAEGLHWHETSFRRRIKPLARLLWLFGFEDETSSKFVDQLALYAYARGMSIQLGRATLWPKIPCWL